MGSLLEMCLISAVAIYSSFASASTLQLSTVGETIHIETTPKAQSGATTFTDSWYDIATTEPSWVSPDQSASSTLTSNNPLIGFKPKNEPNEGNPVKKTAGTSCSPWFSCENGVCTGGMSCTCFDGWAGLFCDQRCPSDCAPHGTCATSSNNQPMCICNFTSTYTPDIGCVQKTPALAATTTEIPKTTSSNIRPLWERECLGIFTCIYGYCQVVSLSCYCDRGWKGQLCDQPCELTCGNHGRCRENHEFNLYCECDNSHYGDRCENAYNITTTKTSTEVSLTTSPATTKQWNLGDWFSVDKSAFGDKVFTHEATVKPHTMSSDDSGKSSSNTGAAALGSRTVPQCVPGFECKHGYCVMEPLSCKCDNGWGGVFCSVACGLSCGEKGTCLVPVSGPPYCECVEGDDTGDDCGRHEAPTDLQTTENGTVSPTTVAVYGNFSENDPWHDLEPKYGLLPPLVERSCVPGFICAYGNCSTSESKVTKCSCLPGFIEIFCERKCPIICGLHADCVYNPINSTFDCFCHEGFTGFNCSYIRGPLLADSDETVLMACLIAALILLFTLLLVVVPVVLYRRRNITMMKIVYWFQQFEEDDNREYDAFVSYASTDQDRQFVLQVLVPKLEGRMCFTLCIHQRNFVPGQFISDNIVESVKQSRRTLLILSPSFVTSGWCRFEYQMALQEMLNEKHRVLPIIIGDISSVMGEVDETLGTILKTITWLKYPNKKASEQEFEKFWKRLQLSMPKKRSGQLETGKSRSCLVSHSAHLSLQSPQDNKHLPSSTTLTNEIANRRLLQRIVRVASSELTSSDKSLSTTSLDQILEPQPDADSQNGNVGSLSTTSDHRLESLEPSLAGSSSDVAPNSSSDHSEAGQDNDVPESHDSSNLNTDLQVSLQDHEEVLESGASKEPEDIPSCMLDNYLGSIELEKNVSV